MYRFTINNLTLKSMQENEVIIPKGINVIVGPNNSGKSRLLKEIRDYLSGDRNDIKIISSIEYTKAQSFDELYLSYDIESKMTKDMYGNWIMKVYSNKPSQPLDMTTTLDNYYTRNTNSYGNNWKTHLREVFDSKDNLRFFETFGSLFFQYLGTEERLTICKTQRNFGMDGGSINYLSSIQYKSNLLNELRKKTKYLFGKDIYLDNKTLGDRLVFRIADNFDYIRNKTIIDENDVKKLFDEKKLDNQGDGIKSFVSTFLSLYANKGEILLIDEPEAFLHPPLARQLGEIIGENHDDRQIIFISTHSVELLKGILSKNKDVNIIRITQPVLFQNSISVINKDLLDEILQNPLLRVSRVLEGLFCDKVVLTEAESDELIYQELIEKIYPASGLYFVHGQNKQTIATIAKLYKKIGITYEIIVDFDVLRRTDEFSKFLNLIDMSEKERQRILNYANKLRDEVDNSVDTSKLSKEEVEDAKKAKRDEVYHKKGINFFNEEIQEYLNKEFDRFSKLHLHILKSGELETLLCKYGVTYQEKKKWIEIAINKITEMKKDDILSDDYLFKFLSGIKGNKQD